MTGRRPQLSGDELQQLKWLLGGALTLLAVWTIFYMDVDAWTLMGITTVATLTMLIRPALVARIPSLLHTLAFPAIVLFFAGDLWFKREILPAMVRLDILLLLYRSISYRQRRDELQIIVLGLFLVVVAGVLTVSLTFAAQLLLYTGCALAFLLAITLTDAANVRPASPENRTVAPNWARHVDWGRLFRRLREVADWRVVGLGFVLFTGVVAVSALLFLAIPRFEIQNGMFLDRFITKKAKSGFNDVIRFGEVTDITQDTSVALSVDVTDQGQIPASPYWRMLVLDQYHNGTFQLSARLRREEFGPLRTNFFLHGESLPRRGPAIYWTFYLESGVSRYLPLLGHFEVLRFRESQNFHLAANLAVVALRDEPATMTAYRVEGFDLSGRVPDPGFARRWAHERAQQSAALRTTTTRVRGVLGEADHATLKRMVEELHAGEAAPVSAIEFMRRAGDWLRAHHNYTLSPRLPPGEGDPLVRWVASREAGHCELFAGSFVLLARTAGFPARVVTGFRGGMWNAYSNNFTIRNSDAHAWAEIFDEHSGAWLRADPLDPGAAAQGNEVRGEAAIARRIDRSWAARLDSLRVFWYRRIVNFDQRSQAETLKAVKEATENSGKRLRAALEHLLGEVKAWVVAPWDAQRALGTAGAVAGLAVVAWIGRRFGRAWWRRWVSRSGDKREDPVRREAGQWLQRLGQTKSHTAECAWIISELERLRFGARATWPAPERTFRQARRLLRDLRRAPRATRT